MNFNIDTYINNKILTGAIIFYGKTHNSL